jgi:hypothetical protein
MTGAGVVAATTTGAGVAAASMTGTGAGEDMTATLGAEVDSSSSPRGSPRERFALLCTGCIAACSCGFGCYALCPADAHNALARERDSLWRSLPPFLGVMATGIVPHAVLRFVRLCPLVRVPVRVCRTFIARRET